MNLLDLQYQNYIKYDRMYNLCMHAFYGMKNEINTITIYLDMNSFTKNLYRDVKNAFVPHPAGIASSVINLCAHLREYFHTRHRIHTNIYIIYGTNHPTYALERIPYYNGHFATMIEAKHFITESIMEACNLLSIICPYLDGIYFIQDRHGNEVATIALWLDSLDRIQNSGPRIIYTKDKFCYHLVTCKNNMFLFRPKKNNEGDCSFVVTKSNLLRVYRSELRYEQIMDSVSPIIQELSPGLFNILIALSGFKSRDIPTAMNFENKSCIINNTTAFKNIKKAIDNNYLINGQNIIITNPSILGVPEELKDLFYRRLEVLSIDYHYSHYNYTPASNTIMESIIDHYDADGIRAINNQYFSEFPLDLNRL